MRQGTRRRFVWGPLQRDLVVLALVCIALGMLGGVPFYHPDFVVKKALRAIQTGGNPYSFNYPGFVIYLNALVYGCGFVIMYLFKLVDGPADFVQLYDRRTLIDEPIHIPFFLLGDLITIAFSILGVISTYLIVYKLTHTRIFALIAGLFLATSLLWAANAHYVTVDIPLGALAVASVLCMLHLTQQDVPRLRHILALGILVGLTASAKYNGAVVLIAALGTLFITYPSRKRWLQHMIMLGLAAASTFIVTNPFMLLDFAEFRSDFAFELAHARDGHPGFTTDRAWWFHITTTLFAAYGWLVLLAAFGGLCWVVATRTLELASKLAITLFPLAYYVIMGSSKLAFQRYMVPLLPFIAVYAALALYAVYCYGQTLRSIRTPQHLATALFVAASLMIAPNVQHTLAHNLLLTRRDTRAMLQAIIHDAQLEQPGTTIVAGRFAGRYFFQSSQITSFGAASPSQANVVTFDSFSDDLPALARAVEQNINAASIVMFDSFSHDELIYDSRLRVPLTRNVFLAPTVIQISPFSAPKHTIPFSPESMYSPYLPDLPYRKAPGPFIELYIRDSATAQTIKHACDRSQVDCVILPSAEGYYYQQLGDYSAAPGAARLHLRNDTGTAHGIPSRVE